MSSCSSSPIADSGSFVSMAVSHSAPSTPSRNRVRAVNPSSPQTPSRIVLLDEFCQREREISATHNSCNQVPDAPLASPSAARSSHSAVPPASPSPTSAAVLPSDLTIVGNTQPSATPGRSNFSAYIVYSWENGGHGLFDTWEEVEVFCGGSSNVLKGFRDLQLADELCQEFCCSEIGELFRQPPSTGEFFVVLSRPKPGVYKNRALAVFCGTQYGGGSAQRLLCGLPEAWSTFRNWKKQGLITTTAARNPELFE
ncbi:hypothetical protein AAF712_014706 [Marasmius tenuissimus]|uniref:Uncharacterized protein n=1 Tax=Marasmius tenuissimus TaxID=585030 RepID=A0ABR2ZBG6_9AGAR